MLGDEHRRGQVGGQGRTESAQRVDPAGGRPDHDDVFGRQPLAPKMHDEETSWWAYDRPQERPTAAPAGRGARHGMSDTPQTDPQEREISRLRDEVEQLRVALEASADEAGQLADDRNRLLLRVTAQAREFQAAILGPDRAGPAPAPPAPTDPAAQAQADADLEELRVAFEEMQVLTEELEAANNSLHATNLALDRRVEERTGELAAKKPGPGGKRAALPHAGRGHAPTRLARGPRRRLDLGQPAVGGLHRPRRRQQP